VEPKSPAVLPLLNQQAAALKCEEKTGNQNRSSCCDVSGRHSDHQGTRLNIFTTDQADKVGAHSQGKLCGQQDTKNHRRAKER
jgi:hypothetical protein